MYSSSNQSAYSFFTKGSSVCAGFAKASQLLFQNIGINSYLVMNTDHMWNYVEYEGKYYVFDATMGTGFRKDSNNYYSGLKFSYEKVNGKYDIIFIGGIFMDIIKKIEKEAKSILKDEKKKEKAGDAVEDVLKTVKKSVKDEKHKKMIDGLINSVDKATTSKKKKKK